MDWRLVLMVAALPVAVFGANVPRPFEAEVADDAAGYVGVVVHAPALAEGNGWTADALTLEHAHLQVMTLHVEAALVSGGDRFSLQETSRLLQPAEQWTLQIVDSDHSAASTTATIRLDVTLLDPGRQGALLLERDVAVEVSP